MKAGKYNELRQIHGVQEELLYKSLRLYTRYITCVTGELGYILDTLHSLCYILYTRYITCVTYCILDASYIMCYVLYTRYIIYYVLQTVY